MCERTTQFFHADVLAGDGFNHIGACDEHLAGLVHHDDKVGQRRRVDGASGSWPADDRDLRNDSRSTGVSFEDFTVFSKRNNTLLDACPTRVQDSD